MYYYKITSNVMANTLFSRMVLAYVVRKAINSHWIITFRRVRNVKRSNPSQYVIFANTGSINPSRFEYIQGQYRCQVNA